MALKSMSWQNYVVVNSTELQAFHVEAIKREHSAPYSHGDERAFLVSKLFIIGLVPSAPERYLSHRVLCRILQAGATCGRSLSIVQITLSISNGTANR